ncbi:MAG: beta-xylosidase [Clostridiales bacterium]|nr:beta-xylosidase [Clostridiales bacterium]
MNMKRSLLCAALCLMLMTAAGACALTGEKETGTMEYTRPLNDRAKAVLKLYMTGCGNPLVTNYFCADPTAVEYEGRLYVYATADQMQYDVKGDQENTYECIRGLVTLSTEDMVNWRYEGVIDVKSIAKWAFAGWAPSVTSRVEEDGKTHFYLYFANSGAGVGVLTATSPTGPWTDPIGKPLICASTEGLGECCWIFDPGVCIDDEGTGWLSFGGGNPHKDTTPALSGNARIVRLGKDMVSLNSEIVVMDAPYHFEANELNFIDGTFVYTYCSNWAARDDWDSEKWGKTKCGICTMCYMTSSTPLDKDSWVYRGEYLKNPGSLGMETSNNHTHMEYFKGHWYIFYHTLMLQKSRGITGGYRGVQADEIKVTSENGTVTVSPCYASMKGVNPVAAADARAEQSALSACVSSCAFTQEGGIRAAKGDIMIVKNADFGAGFGSVLIRAKGDGVIFLFADRTAGEPFASLTVKEEAFVTLTQTAEISGTHDLIFIFDGDVELTAWQFE